MTLDQIEHAIAKQIGVTLEVMAKEDQKLEARIQEVESQGCRITDGGQINGSRWEYTDWRTDEVLAKGRSRKDHDKLQMPDNWYHIDHIRFEVGITEPERIEGLPASLAETLIEWTLDHPEEARTFIASVLTNAEVTG